MCEQCMPVNRYRTVTDIEVHSPSVVLIRQFSKYFQAADLKNMKTCFYVNYVLMLN